MTYMKTTVIHYMYCRTNENNRDFLNEKPMFLTRPFESKREISGSMKGPR
jgi:hypothetical protein